MICIIHMVNGAIATQSWLIISFIYLLSSCGWHTQWWILHRFIARAGIHTNHKFPSAVSLSIFSLLICIFRKYFILLAIQLGISIASKMSISHFTFHISVHVHIVQPLTSDLKRSSAQMDDDRVARFSRILFCCFKYYHEMISRASEI